MRYTAIEQEATLLQRSLFPRLVALCCLAVILAGPSARAQEPVGASPTRIEKDPKLSSLLLALRDAFTQSMNPEDVGPRLSAISAVRSGKLPKSFTDAIRARTMRLSENADVQAYIEMDDLLPESLQVLRDLGVTIEVEADPQSHQVPGRVFSIIPTVQAEIPIQMIRRVEDLPFVRYIRLPDYGFTSDSTGSIDSQGDHILQAGAVRSAMNVNGYGINVGVISTGIGGIFAGNCTTSCGPITNSPTSPSPITLGDLPNAIGVRTNNVLTAVNAVSQASGTPCDGSLTATKSFRANGDLEDAAEGPAGAEGTAMLEIVHDLAPCASLSFTNFDTSLSFEEAVNSLAASNDVVVDDVFFTMSSYDGTSSVSVNTADALNNNANAIRAYITSAGNFALDHYSGTFTPSGVDGFPYTGETGELHLFTGVIPSGPPQPDVTPPPYQTIDTQGFGRQPFDPLINLPPGETITVSLSWNDPVGASSNNYDLFLVPLTCASSSGILPTPPCTISGSQVESSMNPQTGTQDPFQSLSYTNSSATATVTLGIVIQNVNDAAQPVIFDMFITGYGAKENSPNHNFNTVSGSIPAQSDAGGTPVSVISVGAINEIQCSSPDNCTGLVEGFSSQGPTQVTPQVSVPSTKPNIVAVDGVCIDGAGGFGNPVPANVNCSVAAPYSYTPKLFGGTSAAAPHVAAIAALTLQMAPCILFSNGNQSATTTRQILYTALTGYMPAIGTTPAVDYPYPSPLPGYQSSLPNNVEGYGLIDALTTATSLLPVPNTATSVTSSATSNTGASVLLTLPAGLASNPSKCPVVAVQWSGACGTGSANGTQGTTQCPIGVNPVNVSASLNGLSFLPPSEVPPYNVVVTDFVLSPSASSGSSATVSRGAPALFVIQVASSGQGPFINPVALTCSGGLPPGATCLFSPATVTPATLSSSGTATAVSATSTLTIYTSGAIASNRKSSEMNPSKFIALCSPVLVFGFFSFSAKRRTKAYRLLAMGVFSIITCLGISDCGSSHTESQAVTSYTITITGTSNQLVHTTTVTLAIQ